MVEDLIKIKNLVVEYNTKKSILGKNETVYAVNGVSLNIKKGEILAVAGESGCGKSTLARAILKLEEAKSGEILYNNNNILNMDKKSLKEFRKKAQMIFQNPYSSLNPKMKIYETLAEPLKINTKFNNEDIKNIVIEKAKRTGLAEDSLCRYPHEFSGGQRQRIAIARSLVLSPEFIIADEPVSALDVSIQAQIINLLKELKESYKLTFLLITHDMSVIKYLADTIAIMYLGEIVEIGRTDEIFKETKHPYTKALLSSVPQLSGVKDEIVLQGDLPSPTDLPKGCKFHTRCHYCMNICKTVSPEYSDITETHSVKCHLFN